MSNLTQLGSKTSIPESPDKATIECFESPGIDVVEFTTNEFTSNCPKTGAPYFASVYIQYTPDKLCLESKSLKLYLQSYRQERAFAETLAVRVSKDLFSACQPYELTVILKFTPRGGVAINASHTIHMRTEEEVPSIDNVEDCKG